MLSEIICDDPFSEYLNGICIEAAPPPLDLLSKVLYAYSGHLHTESICVFKYWE